MNIYNVIILDESGSMSSIYKETISGINEVLSGIRKNQEEYPELRNYVSIITFEGDGIKGVKTRRDRVPIESIQDFTEHDYHPGGCTPLYDAMGKTLNDMESPVTPEDRVLVTVITDGYENSSTEYSGKTIVTMVDRLRKKGWTLSYIGANQDAVEVARDLHIANALSYDATPTGMVCMSMKMAKANSKFAKLTWNKFKDMVDKLSGEMDEETGLFDNDADVNDPK